MTRQEILTEALKKAIKNGFDILHGDDKLVKWRVIGGLDIYLSIFNHHKDISVFITYERKYKTEEIIFSHPFAKAFWGNKNWYMTDAGHWYEQDEDYREGDFYPDELEAWEYHLQQMVLKEDPLRYLEQFIEAK